MIVIEDHAALDEVFERLGAASFELPNGFANVGAEPCEALSVLGHGEVVGEWARGFTRVSRAGVTPVARGDSCRSPLRACFSPPPSLRSPSGPPPN